MTEPFYAPHQLAELQEGYYAVKRTYELKNKDTFMPQDDESQTEPHPRTFDDAALKRESGYRDTGFRSARC